MTELPILYSFRRCPYAMRARMALLVSGQDIAVREVVLRDKPGEMIAASPKGTVPVLVLPDGGVIDESLDIMHWTLSIRDPEGWLEAEDGRTDALVAANDGPFKRHLDRYKYSERYGSRPIEHRDAGLAILADLDTCLAHRQYLCGDMRSFADTALFPFVRQFAATDRAWFDIQPLPNLQKWLARHMQSALFEKAMSRLKQWRPGDAETRLPDYQGEPPADIAG